MPRTRAQQRAQEEQGQAVSPLQRLPVTTTTRRTRRARAPPAPASAVASQSTNPISLAPLVPAVPEVREPPQVPSKASVVSVFGKEQKVREGTFTFDAPMPAPINLASPPAGHETLASRVPRDPARGEDKAVKISVHNGRTMTMNIPEKQLENLFDYLVKMYGAVEEAPVLTLSTGKRPATEDLEDTRPARKVRLDGALRGEVSSVENLPSHLNLCYQSKQGDATHSQKYRMLAPVQGQGHDYPVVIPTYDAQGYNTGSKIFVPVQGDEDDTDLDSELDAASSSFKEDVPTEQEIVETGQIDGLQAVQALPEAAGIDTQGPEGSVQLAQEHVQLGQEAGGNLLVVPETPNNRGLLGNIVTSAARFIPRFGRATQGRAAPVNAPETPARPAPEAQLPIPQTEPRPATQAQRAVPQTEPRPATRVQRPIPQTEQRSSTQSQTPSQGQSSTLTRAASVQKPQTKGKARASEAGGQLNVRQKSDRFVSRMEPLEIEAKRRAIEQRILELERMEKDLKSQEETYKARRLADPASFATDDDDSVQTPPLRGGWRRRAGLVPRTNTVPETEEQRAANALWPPGRRIEEARKAVQRRKNPSGRTFGPSNGGLDINNDLSRNGSEGDDAATNPNTNVAPVRSTPHDPSYPVGEGDDAATNSNMTDAPAPFTPHDPSFPVGDPYSARPARGFFFGPTPSKLDGGNLFRNVEADQESAANLLFRTPRGEPIVQFNKTGHFQLPDESSSDEDEASSSATKAPAQTPTKAPLPKILQFSPWKVPGTPTPPTAMQATQNGGSAPAATPVLKGILKNTSSTPKVYPKGQWEPYKETIARNKREAAEALAREIAEDAKKRELAEEARKIALLQEEAIASKTAAEDAKKQELAEETRKNALLQEQAIASKTAAAKAAALKYAPKEPSKLNFVEQAASSSLAAETGVGSPTAVEGAEVSSAAPGGNDALTDDGSDDGSTSSADSQEGDAWRGDYQMSQRAIDFVNANFTPIDAEAAGKAVRADYEEWLKTYVPTGPVFTPTPRVQEWLNTPEVLAAIEEDKPYIAAEIRRSFERGFPL